MTEKEVTPLYRLMAEGEVSLFWKTVKEEIQGKIDLINSIESVTETTLELQKGKLRAYRDVLNIPEKLKDKTTDT